MRNKIYKRGEGFRIYTLFKIIFRCRDGVSPVCFLKYFVKFVGSKVNNLAISTIFSSLLLNNLFAILIVFSLQISQGDFPVFFFYCITKMNGMNIHNIS